MAMSHPGIAGVAGGLALGLAQYIIAMNVMRRVVAREMEEGGDMPGLGMIGRRMRGLRNALAGFSFLILPVLGLALGSTLGSQHGGAQ